VNILSKCLDRQKAMPDKMSRQAIYDFPSKSPIISGFLAKFMFSISCLSR